jgi:hypothetical protein
MIVRMVDLEKSGVLAWMVRGRASPDRDGTLPKWAQLAIATKKPSSLSHSDGLAIDGGDCRFEMTGRLWRTFADRVIAEVGDPLALASTFTEFCAAATLGLADKAAA